MLILNKISKRYDSNVIVDNLSIDFPDKGLYSIIGVSGRGKTTLLNIIGGLDNIDSGIIGYNNKPINDDVRIKLFGFIFQDYNLIENLNVFDNLKISCFNYEDKIDLNNKIDAILKKLKIIHLKYKNINNLSGGEKQRVAIARSIIKGSKIILADEPTGNLDEENEVNIFEVLKEISKDILIIVATHNKQLAAKFSDGIIDLDKNIINANIIFNNNANVDSSLIKISRYNYFKNYISLLLNDFKSKRKRDKRLLTNTTIFLVLFYIVYSLTQTSLTQLIDMNNEFFQADIKKISKIENNYNESYFNIEKESIVFNENEINYLIRNNDVKEYTYSYNDTLLLRYRDDDNTKSYKNILNLIFVKDNNFFKNRLKHLKIKGNLILDKESIILSKQYLVSSGLDYSIGQEINIMFYNVEKKLTLVGINETKLPNGEGFSYINEDILKDCIRESDKYNVEIFNSYGISSNMNFKKYNEQNIVLGEKIVNDNEILLGYSVFDYIYNNTYGEHINDFNNLTTNQINNIEKIFNEKFILKFNNFYDVKIVGIVDDFYSYMNQNFINKLKSTNPCFINLYTDTKKEDINLMDNQVVTILNEEFIEQLVTRNKVIEYFLKVIIILFFLVLIISIYSNTKAVFNENMRNIGILETLGYRKSTIISKYILHNVLISLSSLFMTLIIIIIYIYIINPILKINYFYPTFDYRINLLLFFISFLLPFVSSIIPSLSIYKLSIIDRIRQ